MDQTNRNLTQQTYCETNPEAGKTLTPIGLCKGTNCNNPTTKRTQSPVQSHLPSDPPLRHSNTHHSAAEGRFRQGRTALLCFRHHLFEGAEAFFGADQRGEGVGLLLDDEPAGCRLVFQDREDFFPVLVALT